MKTLMFSLALATMLTIFGTGSASAQTTGSVSDYYNDFELYVAEYETQWYTVVTWMDGTTSEYRSYSEAGADQWGQWLGLHYANVRRTDSVSRVELGSWEYVDTFGTYSAAVSEAIDWEQDGFETDIRSIRANWIFSTPYKPITKPFSLK